MLFSRKPTRARLRRYKTVRISGFKFVIRKLNPLIDFPDDKMPQIFTSFISRRKVDPEKQINEAALRKTYQDMKNVIEAGLVYPELSENLTIDDIMADYVLALKLYTEIVVHSLNMFRGLKGLFFSLKTKRLFYTTYASNMESFQMK